MAFHSHRVRGTMAFLAAVAAFATASGAQAGILTTLSYMPGFGGTQVFAGSGGGGTLVADIDYAVFAPGAFPATDPSGGTEYVYAYQIFPQPASTLPLSTLSVGVAYDSGSGLNISGGHNAFAEPTFPDATGLAPIALSLTPTSASFLALFVGLTPATHSEVILFTSPNPPEYGPASIYNGGVSDQENLPTPIPEPAALSLLALGGLALLARRR